MTPERARRIADSEGGLGCDQVLVLRPPASEAAAAAMETFNADGSPAAACGNGARCLAWLLLKSAAGGSPPSPLRPSWKGGRRAPRSSAAWPARPPSPAWRPLCSGGERLGGGRLSPPRAFISLDLPLAGALLDYLGARAGGGGGGRRGRRRRRGTRCSCAP